MPSPLQDPSKWTEYLTSLCHPTPSPSPAPAHTLNSSPFNARADSLRSSAETLNEPFTLEHVETHLAALHVNRSPCLTGLPAEFFRGAWIMKQLEHGTFVRAYTLAPVLTDICNALFRSGSLPESLNTALLTPVYKRGDPLTHDNYRPIAVGEPLYRLYAALLNSRLITWTEEEGLRSQAQAGFRPGKSTLHQLFVLRHAIDKHAHRHQPLFACFVDLRKAFDKVQHGLLWKVLDLLGIHGRMRVAIQSLYNNARLRVKVDGRAGDAQHPQIGVKQGCPMSSTLFGLVIDALEHHLRTEVPGGGCSWRRIS